MENPAFDETIFSKNKTVYKSSKPEKIDREKCKEIEGMEELWKEIDRIDHLLKVSQGKIETAASEEIPQLDSKQLYHLNHQLIELRKQQYILRDSVFPEQQPRKNYKNYYDNPVDFQMEYPVFPCGVMREENDQTFLKPYLSNLNFKAIDLEKTIEDLKLNGKPYFDFRDKEHIYQLCLAYYEIKDQVKDQPDSILNNLLWTLDFYIEKANLTDQQKLIVEGKKLRLLNKDICQKLMDELGIYHQENYVSTIWNRACGLIAQAADLHYDEWCCKDYEKAWKVCSCCGEKLLRDPRNFVRKARAIDGLTHRCKKCDAKKRRGLV